MGQVSLLWPVSWQKLQLIGRRWCPPPLPDDPVAAVAMGAGVIEKHLTLDKGLSGPDHASSLDGREFAAMVKAIRNIEAALGTGLKEPSPSEAENILAARKSIVASKDIKKGDALTEDNMTAKRPGSGLSPMLWDRVLGSRAMRDFGKDDLIEYDESIREN